MSAITDIVTKVREAGQRALARPVGYLGAVWERLAPRQRRLVTAALATAACLIVVFGAWVVFSDISDLEEDNAAIREALKSIATNRDLYLDAKSRSAAQEARIGGDPPQLTGDIEAAAHEEQIEIAESSERPTTPAGRRYVEHDVDIKIREVNLQSLSKFLRRLETGPRLIVFTHLSLKRRFSDQEKLEVEATATAFERVHEEKVKKKPGDATKGTP